MAAFDELQEFVRDRFGDQTAALERLRGGDWSQAFTFRLDGRDAVVRFGVHGEDFAKDALMSRFGSPLLPIPNVIETGATPWGFFCVSERAHGAFLDELSHDGMRRSLPHLLAAIHALRQVELTGSSGFGIWRPNGAAPHASWQDALLDVANDRPGGRIAGWRAALELSPTGSDAFDAAFAALVRGSADLPQCRNLIHGDLLYRNALVGDDGLLAAVFDWGNALFGDPLYDAAWLIYWWPWYRAWREIDVESAVRDRWGSETEFDRRLACCLIHIGLDAQVYNAFRGRAGDLARNAEQTLAVAQARGLSA